MMSWPLSPLDDSGKGRESNAQMTAVRREDGARLAALFELYVYDFSEVLGLDVGDDGRFQAPLLDMYWTDPRCHAFLIRVGERLAGFALVEQNSRLTADEAMDPPALDVAEFFVMRKYRRCGLGERAARWLFDRFRGRWEVRQRTENRAATAFWRSVIDRYTGGRFEDVVWDDERWRGPVQRFASTKESPETWP